MQSSIKPNTKQKTEEIMNLIELFENHKLSRGRNGHGV